MTKTLTALRKNWILILITALIVGVLAGYALGYRLAPGLSIVHTGTLTISNLPDGSFVYTDEIRRTAAVGGTASVALMPGAHTVILDTPGNHPWNELFTITEGEETKLNPPLVPLQVARRPLADAERKEAEATLAKQKLPTKAAPLLLAGGCAVVYAEHNLIIANATTSPSCTPPAYLCTEDMSDGSCAPVVAFAPSEALRSILSFPGRDDALIVASGNRLYALELDPREPRFFAPLLKGTNIIAAPSKDAFILASDGTTIAEIGI